MPLGYRRKSAPRGLSEYDEGYDDGYEAGYDYALRTARRDIGSQFGKAKPKKKPSAWNKFVKTNSKKKEFQYRDGKINLKKLGVAYRRTKR